MVEVVNNSLKKQILILFVCLISGISSVTAQINQCDHILEHPRVGVLCLVGTNSPVHTFTISVHNNPNLFFEYQWERETSGTWTPLTGSGAQTNSFVTGTVGNYRCIVSVYHSVTLPDGTTQAGALVCTQTSNVAALRENFIQEHPQAPASICSHENHIFTIEHSPDIEGIFSYNYRWETLTTSGQWTDAGANSNLRNFNTNTAGTYRCVVDVIVWQTMTNVCTFTSETASFQVHSPPSVPQIFGRSVCIDEDFTARVTAPLVANGREITSYEWLFDIHPPIVRGGAVVNGIVPELTVNNNAFTTGDIIDFNNVNYTLRIENSCGAITSENMIMVVRARPELPTPNDTTYCQGAPPRQMYIFEQNIARWFDVGSNIQIDPPTPTTTSPGTQQWEVSHRVRYEDERYENGAIFCESERATAVVTVLALSQPPTFQANWDLCLNEQDVNIDAQGTSLRWYDVNDIQISIAEQIQINTSIAGIQTYFVTQRETGLCESPKESGEVTVLIRGVASIDNVQVAGIPDFLCPNRIAIIDIVNPIPGAVYRWYTSANKEQGTRVDDFDPHNDIGTRVFETPELMDNTFYYVSIQHGELCESVQTRAVVIYVRDVEMPRIVAPPNLILYADPGKCYSSSPIGRPIVSDNCSPVESILVFLNPNFPNVPDVPNIFLVGDTTLTWWAQDEVGNRDFSLQSIRIVDNQAPVGGCPSDIIWEINENEFSATVFYELNYEDNCGEFYEDLNRGLPSGSVFPLGETPIRWFITDKAGNVDTCAFNVNVRPPYRPMEVNLRYDRTSVCPNEPVVIVPEISGGTGSTTYMWRPFGRTTPEMHDFPTVNTTYEVTITDGVTTHVESVDITVLRRTPVELTIVGRRMEEIFEGQEVLVTATPGFDSYKLLFEDRVVQLTGTNHSISFNAEIGMYDVQVFATDENNCVSEDFLRIWVDSKVLPNVFTPNLDGANDIFLEGYLREGDRLEVYNRAGLLLYSGHEGWDGYYKGVLMPQGTYTYIVWRIMNNGELRPFRGVVTLIL